MPQLSVRSGRKSEEAILQELAHQNIWDEMSRRMFNDWFNGEKAPYATQTFVGEKDKKIIGAAAFEIADHFAPKEIYLELATFFIIPGVRRQGNGRELLLASIEQAKGVLCQVW